MNSIREFDQFLSNKLGERESEGLYRSLVRIKDKVDFSSNDYLGFSTLEELNSITTRESASGATGSRLISGNSPLAEETEDLIADFHQSEAALIFNSGYMANVGLFSCIAGKGDSFIADEFIHASMIDGMRLSHATRFKFKHNDLIDLEKKLHHATGRKIVAIESIYSMDGDEAPLIEIAALCEKNNALLIVDEAHATGIYGDRGEGLVCKYGLRDNVYACVYTFGKALGLHGAVVTGSHVLRNYLINYARSFIYATALPPHTYRQIQTAYQLLPDAGREKLHLLIDYFRTKSQNLSGISFVNSSSAIQGIIIGENQKAKNLSGHLFNKGYYTKAILSPTVPPGTERLRICLHTFNTPEQIDAFLIELRNFLE